MSSNIGMYLKSIFLQILTGSQGLWQKQPLSLTVVDYYKALLGKADESPVSVDSSQALLIAQTWLPVYDYFERQFEVMEKHKRTRTRRRFSLYVALLL